MDMIFVAVVIILAGFGLHGYLRGLVRVLFSMVAIFLAIGLASALTPYVSEFLQTKTPLYGAIQEKCTKYMEECITENTWQKEDKDPENQHGLNFFGLEIPQEIQDIFEGNAVEQADGLLEDAGIYEKIGEFLAEQILQRAAWVLSFLIVYMIMLILIHVLDLIAKLPVLNGINHLAGLLTGLVQGLIVVWLLFLPVALCQGSEWGRQMMESIQQNVFLKLLYENNLIEQFIMGILS